MGGWLGSWHWPIFETGVTVAPVVAFLFPEVGRTWPELDPVVVVAQRWYVVLMGRSVVRARAGE